MDATVTHKNHPTKSSLKPALRRLRYVLEGAICGVASLGLFVKFFGLSPKDTAIEMCGAALGALVTALAIYFRNFSRN